MPDTLLDDTDTEVNKISKEFEGRKTKQITRARSFQTVINEKKMATARI